LEYEKIDGVYQLKVSNSQIFVENEIMDKNFIGNVREKNGGLSFRHSIYCFVNSLSHSNDPLVESANENKIIY
jgi:hypothetical protein